jgi:hypothetical protein
MINNTKTIKDRDPYWLINWSKNKDGSPICCNTFHLIDFFIKNEKNKKRHCSDEFNYCECDFEKVVNESNDPHLMRTFLVVTNIVDETFFHLLNHHYEEFRSTFPLPRMESHSKRGEVGNINLIHLREFEDEKDKRLYIDLFREVTDILIQDLWHYGANDTRRGFIDGLMDHCSECHKETYYSDQVINCIRSQAKMTFVYPPFYSALRKEIKTNKKVLF